MKKQSIKILFLLGLFLLLVNAAPILGQDTQPQPVPLSDIGAVDTNSGDTAVTENLLAPDTQLIQLNFNPTTPTGVGRCEVAITPWPDDAKTAVLHAAAIWSTLLNGSQPIVIDVCWSTDFDPAGQLANCGSSGGYLNFPGAPQQNTYYPLPLANQLSNSDLNGTAPDMQCRFNAHRANPNHPSGWYMGLDGIVPANEFDLVSVGLHEIGHGLGFEGSAGWNSGNGSYGNPPDIYDRFVQTTNGTNILAFTNNSPELGNALIGDALVFNGVNANAANGGAAPRLFAPSPWEAGSSYQHLREDSFQNIPNGLMTPAMPNGVAIHHPGVVALGMLKDMGWEIYDLSHTYVDKNNTGFENGGVLHPFNTANEGVNAVPFGGRVFFFAGEYREDLTISRSMSLESISGTVILGD